MKLFFHRLFHWEYWPYQIVYIPVYLLGFYCAFRTRSFYFFNAANPTIRNGGFMAESKKEIYDLIPQKYYPKTELIQEKTSLDNVYKILKKSEINFPFIAKPDVGLRGSAVKKINSINELKKYASKANFDFLIQELIPFENEIGVFYVCFPNEKLGKITGIVRKEFLIITGDGTATILDLIQQNPRYEMQLDALTREYGSGLNQILKNGEKRNLVPYGNHIRGAKFLDDSHKISDKLNSVFNEMCSQIDGFYFGRLDIMFSNYEDLENGKNFQIVELNGSGSEPTHIYDPKHSLFFAWKELWRHIYYMYKISVQNHKKGIAYLSRKEGKVQFKLHYEQSAKIVNF